MKLTYKVNDKLGCNRMNSVMDFVFSKDTTGNQIVPHFAVPIRQSGGKKRAAIWPPFGLLPSRLFLYSVAKVFAGLELSNLAGLDFHLFASLRVTAHAS